MVNENVRKNENNENKRKNVRKNENKGKNVRKKDAQWMSNE